MRGSISRLSQKLGCGFILGEDGREACFDLSSLQGVDIRALSVEKTVEYEEHFENERLRAVRVRVMPNALKQIRRWGSEMSRGHRLRWLYEPETPFESSPVVVLPN